MLHRDDCKWMCRMKADLERQEVHGRDGPRDGPVTIFRVPPSIRELNEESYKPKYLSFGLYNRRNSLLYTICLDFVSVFKEITGEKWSSIYSKALEGKSVKDWMELYDGIKLEQSEEKDVKEKDVEKKDVEEKVAKEKPEDSLAWEEETGQNFLAWDAIFVVCFLLADHLRNCRETCLPNNPFLGSLLDEIQKKTVAPMVNVIRLDIFKFENQIPLGLIKNVFNMISSMYTDRPSTSTSTPDTDHKLNFDTFVTHAVSSVYCDLPKPRNLREFKLTMKELDFEKRMHLLECLYLVVCCRPKSSKNQKGPQPVAESGRPSVAARAVEKRDGDQQPTGGTSQSGNIGGHRVMAPTSGNNSKKLNCFQRLAASISVRKRRETVSVDVENRGATDPPQSSNGGDGGSLELSEISLRSRACHLELLSTEAQDDKGKSPHDDADPPQNSSGGGRDRTSAGAQRDEGKSPPGDADPLQNSNGGGGHGQSDGAQRDKGKSPRGDVGPSQKSDGGRGVGTSGGTQHDKGKSPQGDVDPRQSSNGGGVEGTRGTQDEKGKSPQGDADPPQSSNGGRGEGTSAAQHDRVKSLQVDRCSAELPNSDGGAASRNGFANLVEWMFTCLTICQGSQTHRNGQRRHNHTQGLGTPTITKLRESNIAVKREDNTKWMSEVNFRTSIFSYKGELYLPEFGVFDETQTLLRNLLVYEYAWQKERDLLSFIHLLNNLINTEEDVRRMKESGVLKNNSLGTDKEVADMWHTMLSGFVIIPSRHYQFNVFDKISNHRKKFIPKRLGELKILYNKPWQFFGLLAAFVTIVATILAMVYTIITYYDGNKQRAQT